MTSASASAPALWLRSASNGRTVEFRPRRLVIAGYTARDQQQARRHIDELAAMGIPAPSSVPAFYDAPVSLLTQQDQISVASDATSGEAEPVLYCTEAGRYIGVGSDHTDRDVERESIAGSKRACPKPVSSAVLPAHEVAGQWDSLRLRSSADGIAYQDSPLSVMMSIDAIIDAYHRATGGDTDGLVLFLGTVPVHGGEFRYSETFTAELVGKNSQPLLSSSYRVEKQQD